MKFPRLRIHLLTAIILQIVLGALIWANIHAQPQPFSVDTPLDEFRESKKLIDRGWPAVARTAFPREMRHAGDAWLYVEPAPEWKWSAVAIDAAVAIALLTITWRACERLLYKEDVA